MNNSVNVPTDPEQQNRDVDNKLRLYGIYNGKFLLERVQVQH
jgi:hypothetical protein